MANLPRDDDGQLAAYAWPGGYSLIYVNSENSIFCLECARDEDTDPDSFWPIADAFIHWEGESMWCDCGHELESEYGIPD